MRATLSQTGWTRMQTRNVPAAGVRYWTALSVASVFGANMGDFVSKNLHLGHWSGLPYLAAILAVTFAAEQRLRLRTVAFYWLAIVTMRTMATNLGDLITHDFKVPFPLAMAALAAMLAAILVAQGLMSPQRKVPTASRVPDTDTWYWVAMLTAGTLGTVAGDFTADYIGLGDGGAALLLSGILAAIFMTRGMGNMTGAWFYWVTVVAIRSAGTSVGDYLAGRHGLNLGLALTTPVTGLVLVALLLVWRKAERPIPVGAE